MEKFDREKKCAVRSVRLSERLQALAGMVTPGNVVADVGCDHGFLSIYLVEQGIAPKVIATDVRKGPLSAARAHVEEKGLAEYIETRLSDGLSEYQPGEAHTMVCAGMGGKLMQRILLQNMDVTLGFEELILQPQSELRQFRVFLREQGFVVLDENILCEDGKYYFMFRVRPAQKAVSGETVRGNLSEDATGMEPGDRSALNVPRAEGEEVGTLSRLGDKYGAGLLAGRHPVLRDYLEKCLSECKAVREQLISHRGEAGSNVRIERSLAENEAEMTDLHRALALYGE